MSRYVFAAMVAIVIALAVFHTTSAIWITHDVIVPTLATSLVCFSMAMTLTRILGVTRSALGHQCLISSQATFPLLAIDVWALTGSQLPNMLLVMMWLSVAIGILISVRCVYFMHKGRISFIFLLLISGIQVVTVFYALRAGSENVITSISHALFGSLLLLLVPLIERLPKVVRRSSGKEYLKGERE